MMGCWSLRDAWACFMANQPHGLLYPGVTGHLARRIWERRERVADGFTKRHGCTLLVYAERHEAILTAIQREKTIKHWPRAWKVRTLGRINPAWTDFYDQLSA